jgi:hypothetical protein
MKRWWLAAVLALCACGKEDARAPKAPPAPPPAAAPAPKPAVKSDPAGKNLCLSCQIRTNDATCPGCKAVLKAPVAEEKPKAAPGEVGKSVVAAVYACPVDGCKITFPSKNVCAVHKDKDLKLQLFVCGACKVEAAQAGKCAQCGADLKRELR